MTATQVRSASYPTAPVPEAIEGTLLDIVTPGSLGEYLYGQGLFESFSCLETGIRTENNCGPTGTLGTDSKFEDAQSAQWMDGLRFTAYGTTVCKMTDFDAQKAGTERAYRAAESRVIEAALMSDVFVASAGSTQFPGVWDAAEDLTPSATAVEATKGLGILESHMARYYAGKGIIHMPRLVATLLLRLGALHMEGKVLYTGLGTPVAAGAGYDYPNTGPDGDEATDGEKWIYATGLVVIERQKLVTDAPFNIHSTGTDVPGISPNDNVVLTEGTYVVSVDCYKSAISVVV